MSDDGDATDEAPPTAPDPAAAVSAVLEQVRWLHDYHERRGMQFQQRAATLLGLGGVVLALLFNGAGAVREEGGVATVLLVVLLVITLAAFTWSAYRGVQVLKPADTTAPGVQRLRKTAEMTTDLQASAAEVLASAVEAFAHVQELAERSLLDEAKKLADDRGTSFACQTKATVVGLALLAVLVVALALLG